MSSIFIPERFRKVVLVHLFKNAWSSQIPDVPLVLGIHGPPGWGKTFQCERILTEIGAKVFLISGGQLESKNAGEPAEMIRFTYLAAGKFLDKQESALAVLLINDVDTGLGNWGDNVQTTINTQTVFGELMHLTDYPTIVNGRKTRRIPVILTGNDFTKLYTPLTRAGRMVSFEWLPNYDEKIAIIARIFPELQPDECKTLIDTLESYAANGEHEKELNIAFYSHLRSSLYDDIVWRMIRKIGLEKVLSSLRKNKVPGNIRVSITLSLVLEKGQQLISSSKFTNHLVGEK